jgi:hypothetical protein
MMRTSMVSKGRRAMLRLESLEGRDVPANLVWTAAGDGSSWSDSDNWAEFSNGNLIPSGTPTSADTLFFGSLGGANASSVVDADFTVEGIVQDSSYTGELGVGANDTLTVIEDFTVHGAIDLTAANAELVSGAIYLIGGDIAATTSGDPNYRPITTGLLDLVNGATLTIAADEEEFATLQTNLVMGTGTTFRISGFNADGVIVDGSIGTSGTVHIEDECSLTVTGNYSQAAGNLLMDYGSALTIEGTSPANLSGHSVVFGQTTIEADTVLINGDGVMELIAESDDDTLTIIGDLDVAGGTFKFSVGNGILAVTGDLNVFIGTLIMRVGVLGGSDRVVVDGSVDLGPDEGGPTLILVQRETITPPTTFFLIFCAGTGTDEFFNVEAGNAVITHGWVAGTTDAYRVVL